MFHQEHIITSELVRVEAPGLASREVLISDGSLLRLEELAPFSLDVVLDVERVFLTASEFAASNPLKAPIPLDGRVNLAHPA
jgi:hypothetical protein